MESMHYKVDITVLLMQLVYNESCQLRMCTSGVDLRHSL